MTTDTPYLSITTNLQAALCIISLDGSERHEPLDAYLQSLWDGADESAAPEQMFVDVGGTTHDKPAPFSDDLTCSMALAVRLLGSGPIDIEVAYRVVGHARFGRAEICGPMDDASGKAATPALALIVATLSALDDRKPNPADTVDRRIAQGGTDR